MSKFSWKMTDMTDEDVARLCTLLRGLAEALREHVERSRDQYPSRDFDGLREALREATKEGT